MSDGPQRLGDAIDPREDAGYTLYAQPAQRETRTVYLGRPNACSGAYVTPRRVFNGEWSSRLRCNSEALPGLALCQRCQSAESEFHASRRARPVAEAPRGRRTGVE